MNDLGEGCTFDRCWCQDIDDPVNLFVGIPVPYTKELPEQKERKREEDIFDQCVKTFFVVEFEEIFFQQPKLQQKKNFSYSPPATIF